MNCEKLMKLLKSSDTDAQNEGLRNLVSILATKVFGERHEGSDNFDLSDMSSVREASRYSFDLTRSHSDAIQITRNEIGCRELSFRTTK